jgi:tRNA nucleotidyltransferase (CCA-adding enzyme)
MKIDLTNHIPESVSQITQTMKKAGFEAFLVGGCVRDLIIGRKPKDWDVTTNATPEDIMALFKDTFYENVYGTVGIVNKEVSDETLRTVEATPYRIESEYSDNRRPDSVVFSKNIEDDLKRRDFTINAIAYDVEDQSIIDLYGGISDLKQGIIKTVGEADKRFNEDGLRILRAVRLSTELSFAVNHETAESIVRNRGLLKNISQERIREEFSKVLMSANPKKGLENMREMGLVSFIIPELEESFDIGQNQAHKYDVFEHLLRTLQHSADKGYSLELRLAALLHDIGKPRSKRFSEETKQPTFYGHDVIGARMTEKILTRLKFSKKIIEDVTKLVRWHMFFSDTEQVTLSAVRRMVANVGKEHIWDLMNLRVCDRVGTGRPKENPYRLRKYKAMVEEAMVDPISVSMLKIDGKGIMEVTKSAPGPKIGFILHALLEEVLENPALNTKEYLENKTVELFKLSVDELKKIGDSGKKKKAEEEEKMLKEIRGKHFVD